MGQENGLLSIVWHPDGSVFAIPGPDDGVIFYFRKTWREAFRLQTHHSTPISLLAFSPNGRHRL